MPPENCCRQFYHLFYRGDELLLTETGINEAMISPFAKLMKVGCRVLGYRLSDVCHLFFLSPGVALIGAVLLPAAIRAAFSDRRGYGDEPVHGFALSGITSFRRTKLTMPRAFRGRCHAGKYSARFDHGVNDDNHRFLPHHAGSKNEDPLSLDSSGSLDTSMYLPKNSG